ncbi:MAG TPA: PAS domain-containing protein [Kamptonema sp.]|nr:PAS domain-containing protein [Kamptonema sp.]
MDIFPQIKAVFQRALLLRQRATESPIQQDLIDAALKELYYVLDELQATEEELRRQSQDLSRTRQQVEAERQRYQDLFNFAPDGYLVTDSQGMIQEANLAIASMLNVSQQYLVNKPLLVFISEEARQEFQLELAGLHQQQKIQDWEIRLLPHNNGQPFDAAISISIIRDPASRRVSLRWLIRNINERKDMQLL